MAIPKTEGPPVIDKKAKIAQLRVKHEALLKRAVPDGSARFIPKLMYKPAGGTEYVIAVFPSELEHGGDFYVEFATSDFETQEDGKLWKWTFNKHYAVEYDKTDTARPAWRYLIPVEELVDVAELYPELKKTKKLSLNSTTNVDPTASIQDDPIADMTIRDKYAIHWNKAVSQKAWLNKLITENQ